MDHHRGGSLAAQIETDYIDILLLHRPDVLWQGEEIAEAFAQLHAAGKVRYFGVSNQNRFQIEYLQRFLDAPLVANQIQMSLLHYDFAEVSVSFNQRTNDYPQGLEGLMEYCRLNGISLQAWSPMDRGILFSKPREALSPAQQNTAALLSSIAAEQGVAPEAVQLGLAFAPSRSDHAGARHHATRAPRQPTPLRSMYR